MNGISASPKCERVDLSSILKKFGREKMVEILIRQYGQERAEKLLDLFEKHQSFKNIVSNKM